MGTLTTLVVKIDDRTGRHVMARLFAGPDRDHQALAGHLTMTYDEWRTFADLLLAGAPVVGTEVVVEDRSREART